MLLGAMRDAGGDVMGVDSHVELDEAWRRLGPTAWACRGTWTPWCSMATRISFAGAPKRVLDQAAGRPGHIFNLGHGLLPDTPYENVVALVKMVHDLSSEQIARGHRSPPRGKLSGKSLDQH